MSPTIILYSSTTSLYTLLQPTHHQVRVSNEVLAGMKVVKFQAWEGQFEDRINAIRDRELALYRR